MLTHELYRRALATLADVDRLHVAFRSIDYHLAENCPQCAVMRTYIRYVAPDQIRVSSLDCNPAAQPQRSDVVQAGDRAYRRQPGDAGGEWTATAPVLTSRDDLPALIAGRARLPSPEESAGGSRWTTAFPMPELTAITIQGHEHRAIVSPMKTHLLPWIYLPGTHVPRGLRSRHVAYLGVVHRLSRVADSGQLFIDARTALPLRYLSAIVATLEDETSVVLSRTHVRFRYDDAATMSLSVKAG